jgi:hypothetical protein
VERLLVVYSRGYCSYCEDLRKLAKSDAKNEVAFEVGKGDGDPVLKGAVAVAELLALLASCSSCSQPAATSGNTCAKGAKAAVQLAV